MFQEPPVVNPILMPLPTASAPISAGPGAGGALPAGVRLQPVFTGVSTPRLERALARFLAICGPGSEAAVPLRVCCAQAGAGAPALGDDERYALEVSAAGVRID